jgi:hypothetical protein
MPPLVGNPCRLDESLLCASACLGLLLYHDTGFYLLIGVGPHLLHMWWPLSCKGNTLLGRGSWIAERVSWSHGRKDWWPLRAHLGSCGRNVTLVMSMSMLSSSSSSPSSMRPIPGPNNLSTSVGRWRNARSFSAYKRLTWRCMRRYWWQDMSAELDKAHALADGITDEHAVEAM